MKPLPKYEKVINIFYNPQETLLLQVMIFNLFETGNEAYCLVLNFNFDFRIENGFGKPRFDLRNESDSEEEYEIYNKRCRLC